MLLGEKRAGESLLAPLVLFWCWVVPGFGSTLHA